MQVSQAFAEMMFKHGFVHCDPHAANLLVRPLPSSKSSILGEASLYVKLPIEGSFQFLAISDDYICQPWQLQTCLDQTPSPSGWGHSGPDYYSHYGQIIAFVLLYYNNAVETCEQVEFCRKLLSAATVIPQKIGFSII